MFGTLPSPTTATSASMRVPSSEAHGGQAAVALERGDARAEDQSDAVAGVQARGPAGDDVARARLHRRGRDVDHRHLEAELARGRGDLAADEPRADHHERARVVERRAQAQAVVDRAQQEDAVEVRARPSGEASGRAAAPVAITRPS